MVLTRRGGGNYVSAYETKEANYLVFSSAMGLTIYNVLLLGGDFNIAWNHEFGYLMLWGDLNVSFLLLAIATPDITISLRSHNNTNLSVFIHLSS